MNFSAYSSAVDVRVLNKSVVVVWPSPSCRNSSLILMYDGERRWSKHACSYYDHEDQQNKGLVPWETQGGEGMGCSEMSLLSCACQYFSSSLTEALIACTAHSHWSLTWTCGCISTPKVLKPRWCRGSQYAINLFKDYLLWQENGLIRP